MIVNIIGDLCLQGIDVENFSIDDSIKKIFASGDFNIANLENPLTESNHGKPYQPTYLKCGPENNHIYDLFNVFSLANNHIMDYGRDNDYLILNDGTRISGGTFYAALEYFQYMRQFRIIQKEFGHCDILVSLLNSQEKNKNEIKNTIDKILLNKISYKIKFVDKIPIDPNGKTKILVSKIQ